MDLIYIHGDVRKYKYKMKRERERESEKDSVFVQREFSNHVE
jgi:hypothetical protein